MDYLIIFGAKYLFLVSIFVAIWWFVKQSGNKYRTFWFIFISLFLAFIIGKTGNLLVENPRPFEVENFTPLIPHEADNGFPSDHTLLVATIAAILWSSNKKIGVVAMVVAILVGISRIFAGVHHFADILGSFVIAILSVYLVYMLFKRRRMI